MPVDSFRFVSPGVFINEIDQSQIGGGRTIGAGPVIFGVAEKGPALVPTRVTSFQQFVSIFGSPLPGTGFTSDVWRDGNYSDPTYGAYAAQAYLANGSPLTFVRLVGDEAPTAGTGPLAQAGWEIPPVGAAVTGPAGSNTGVWGLFIVGSGSNAGVLVNQNKAIGLTPDPLAANHGEGLLAAVFYTSGSTARVMLSGALGESPIAEATASTCALVRPVEVQSDIYEYKVVVQSSLGIKESSFNFNPKSARYIRNVFNTNPQVLNTNITADSNKEAYWLGETFGRSVVDFVGQLHDGAASITINDMSGTYGCIIPLASASTNGTVDTSAAADVGGGEFESGYVTPGTPWIIGQDLGSGSNFDINANASKLFRVHSRNGCEYAQDNYKISFADIKQSVNPQYDKYGTFSLLVRDIRDTDENPVILEQFNNLNLNPLSNNYIGKRIGDRSYSYDTANSKWTEVGQYDVRSAFIRVQMDDQVDTGDVDETLIPFGFRGIPTYRGINFVSGSTACALTHAISLTDAGSVSPATGPDSILVLGGSGSVDNLPGCIPDDSGIVQLEQVIMSGSLCATASLMFPVLPQRVMSSDGRLTKETNAFFGLSTNQSRTVQIYDGTVQDLIRMKPTSTISSNMILSPGFSLDDLVVDNAGTTATHSGSELAEYSANVLGSSGDIGSATPYRGTPAGGRRAPGASLTAMSASYTAILDLKFNKFTVPMYGGFNGFDIQEKSPFNNTRALQEGVTKTISNNAMYYTLRKAIDSVTDVDQININMAAMPGITDTQVTDYLMSMADERKDTLAIIDLAGGYTSSTENNDSFTSRQGSSAQTVTNLKDRNLNTSYACAYYPWVQIADAAAGARVWVPPSTIALGVLASSAARSELWFAPAGFNRGGLNNSNAGLNVVNVIEKLTATQRDNLYDVNINPIASFPAEGIVIFGQKTLQANRSALDRINVRRLMIYLKKQITLISNQILFDPNIQITWDRFLNRVNPFLESVKNRFGLSDYRVILDASTTTPDLVDRNILYAKILLKPTRAIEFIALDFVITRTGVEF